MRLFALRRNRKGSLIEDQFGDVMYFDNKTEAKRLRDRLGGNTVVTLTHGNKVVEVDPAGKIVWECSNADLPDTFKDPCGAQWLPNGNIVVTSYAAKGDAIKLFEINREKKIVWSRQDGKPGGIHEFQILDTNGKPLEGTLYR
jgi:hypothetical protein